MLCLTYFVVCGVSRLARFNVTAAALADAATGKVKYFEGTLIPSRHSSGTNGKRRQIHPRTRIDVGAVLDFATVSESAASR